MYVRMYGMYVWYAHTYVHTNVHTFICRQVHVCMHVLECVRMHVCMDVKCLWGVRTSFFELRVSCHILATPVVPAAVNAR